MIVSTKQDILKNLFKVCAAINLIMSLTKGTIHIGGAAPSVYSKKILREAEIDDNEFRQRIESNLIDYDKFMADDFDGYFIDRAKKIIKIIEKAMGKSVADKGSEQTILQFGCSLDD